MELSSTELSVRRATVLTLLGNRTHQVMGSSSSCPTPSRSLRVAGPQFAPGGAAVFGARSLSLPCRALCLSGGGGIWLLLLFQCAAPRAFALYRLSSGASIFGSSGALCAWCVTRLCVARGAVFGSLTGHLDAVLVRPGGWILCSTCILP